MKDTYDPRLTRCFDQLADAQKSGLLSSEAATRLQEWLTVPHFAEYVPAIADHIRRGEWKILQEVFWTTIPFGTAGRRGKMYPFGPNAINQRTVGETIQALAGYIRNVYEGAEPPTCAIAYDTRHLSAEFAKLSAEIMLAAGFDVIYFEGFRATPLLATTVRYKRCACGVMISASHNPPSDNAVKVFWSHGGQLNEPHDAAVSERIANVGELRRFDFQEGVRTGRVHYVSEEMDAVYRDAVLGEGFGLGRGPRDLKILYSPLHGVGLTSVLPVLQSDGFRHVAVFGPHAEPNGCFPNVPQHIANPEQPEVFDAIIEEAIRTEYDLVLASDPDADRVGCAAPLTSGGAWRPLTGNQIAVLLTDYVCRKRRAAGSLTPEHFIVKTLVTTEMVRRVADGYGVVTHGNCLTGFKWIAREIEEHHAEKCVLAAEEAHGYLIGNHTRDKDGAVAAMLLAELAAELKTEGQTLHEQLEQLYTEHGRFAERTIAKTMPGADGIDRMRSIMRELRRDVPHSWGDFGVARRLDYARGIVTSTDGIEQPLLGPRGDLVILELDQPGGRIAIRPSGTEPKIKFYLFVRLDAATREDAEGVLDRLEEGITTFARGSRS